MVILLDRPIQKFLAILTDCLKILSFEHPESKVYTNTYNRYIHGILHSQGCRQNWPKWPSLNRAPFVRPICRLQRCILSFFFIVPDHECKNRGLNIIINFRATCWI